MQADRSAILRRAKEDGRKTVALLHEQAGNLFGGHEIILDLIVERVRGLDWSAIEANPGLVADLEGMDHRLDEASEIVLADADGKVRATSVHNAAAAALVAPDPDCLRRHRNGEEATCVSRPYLDRITGQRLFALSRRLSDGGGFKGVAHVAISIDYFLDIWSSIRSDPGDAVTLARSDGVVLAQYPPRPDAAAPGPDEAAAIAAVYKGDEGVTAGRLAGDAADRVVVYRRIAGYPVYVALWLDKNAALGEWYRNLVVYGLLVLVAIGALLAASLVTLQRLKSEQRLIELWRSETAQREAAQAELLQSRKMESLGQLTGGVAHDFNNLLTAIIGNIDLVIARAIDERARRLLGGAMASAQRGVRLTQRLLAFARRQHLEPTAIDPRDLVAGLRDLLLRTLGPSIRLEVEADADVAPAHVDRNHFELVLLNLAVNARDAMPKGGTLRIAISNRRSNDADAPPELPAGDYVLLSMSDTGTGMDEATLARAAEPFFTTKEVGKGTGLGLSMAHGIALQSGGAMRLRSALGRGTTVELWLPRAAAALEEPLPPAEPALITGTGSILLCEDDCEVSQFVVAALEDAGYEVIETRSGAAALSVLERRSDIKLLLVDFAMPEMNGAAVARLARRSRADLPVLLITGNVDSPELQSAAAGLPILRKPFKRAELAAEVKAVMAS